MKKGRKTIEVETLKKKMNYLLANDVDRTGKPASSFISRQMTCIWLEGILMDTGNYNGFRYLEQSDVPEGQEPGIVHTINGPQYPDEYRREYY